MRAPALESAFSLPPPLADQIFTRIDGSTQLGIDAGPAAPRSGFGAVQIDARSTVDDHGEVGHPNIDPDVSTRNEVTIDDASLIASLTLRDTAREALRARLIGAGELRERRSAYEIVFLMLAFAVTVLVSAPPLVRLAYAIHGSQPG